MKKYLLMTFKMRSLESNTNLPEVPEWKQCLWKPVPVFWQT